jgi:hypothetical protein
MPIITNIRYVEINAPTHRDSRDVTHLTGHARMTLTPQNQKAMDRRVNEYARKGNWAGVVRVMGGSGKADLCDWLPIDDADAPAGAPNFV